MEVFVLNCSRCKRCNPLDKAKGVFLARERVITLFCPRASSSEVLNVVSMFGFSFSVLFVVGSSSFFQFSIWKKFPDVPNVELCGIFSSHLIVNEN